MTFIASVVAKDGVAIIADSLVTTSKRVLEAEDFINFINEKFKDNGGNFKLDYKEIGRLFKEKPSHTKDYEDKLYQYDNFTAITTAGSASINGKRIKKLVNQARKKLKPNDKTSEKEVLAKLNALKDFISKEVQVFLGKNEKITSTILLFTTFSPINEKTLIFKIIVNSAKKANLTDPDFEYVTIQEQNYPVICEGQNLLSDTLLFGTLKSVFNSLPILLQQISKDHNLPPEANSQDYMIKLLEKCGLIGQYVNDMYMRKFSELSLQQAVDLASLLMRIEMDIQKYTENIPTVGGVVKLTVIDEKGFRYLSGHEIVKHESF